MRKLKLFTLLIVICVSVPAWAQSYTATKLPIMGEKSSWVGGINNSGQVVGWLSDSNDDTRAVLWQGSSVIDLGLGINSYAQDINEAGVIVGRNTVGPVRIINLVASSIGSLGGQAFGFANAINNPGQITGSSWVIPPVAGSGITRHAYLYTSGSMIDLGTLGGFSNFIYSEGTGINDNGWVVGVSNTVSTGGNSYGFVHRGSVMEALPSLYLDKNSSAADINNAGIIVGHGVNVLGLTLSNHAAVWEGDAVISIHKTISRQHSFARAINERGDIVGRAFTAGAPFGAAYLWEAADRFPISLNNVTTNLDDWFLTQALDINDCGQIACVARKLGNDTTRAFLLTPESAAIIVASPELNELWISGQEDTIRWTACEGIAKVNILYSVDWTDAEGGSFNSIALDILAESGKLAWEVPEEVARNAYIRIEDATNSSIQGWSEHFRIKGYRLTRIDAAGEYETFWPTRSGWPFANSNPNAIWPQSWWSQFDYANASDPNTFTGYPATWPFFPIRARPANFPSWPAWVRAFGIANTYLDIGFAIYRPSAIVRWAMNKGDWGGSCTGMALTSQLAFDFPAAFKAQFPAIGSFNELIELSISNERRMVINEMWTRQMGSLMLGHRVLHSDDSPLQTLVELRNLLLQDAGDHAIIAIRHQNGSGGHAITPHLIRQDPVTSKQWYVWVYDNNFPSDHQHWITIDTAANTWASSDYANWGGTKGMYLYPPATNFLAPVDLSRNRSSTYEALDVAISSQTSPLYIYASISAETVIWNDLGDSIGYADSVAFGDLAGADHIIPETGSFHPPIGYVLPVAAHSIRLQEFLDSISSVTIVAESLLFTYDRTDAEFGQSDVLEFDPAIRRVSVYNPDPQSKSVTISAYIVGATDEKVFSFSGLSLAQNDSMAFVELNRSDLHVFNYGSAKTGTITLTRATTTLERVVQSTSLDLPAFSSSQFVPDWDSLDASQVMIITDLDLDGTPDDTTFLAVSTSVGPTSGALPVDFDLAQNYPNPFNASTEIAYALPAAGHVDLVVYNIVGQRVAVLVDAVQPAGQHRVLWNGRDERGRAVSSGVYLYRLATEAGSVTKKMVLLK